MAKQISPREAKLEAAKYLGFALALLDEAHAFEAAIHVSTALDVINRTDENVAADFGGKTPFDFVSNRNFPVEWGTLRDIDKA